MDKVVARMQTIRTANTYVNFAGATVNYDTDIGNKVEDSRPNWSEEDDLASGAVSVFQGTVTPDDTLGDDEQINVIRKMPVMIKAFLLRGASPAAGAALARKAIKDIYAAIRVDSKWQDAGTPLARSTKEVSHGVEYAPDSFEITGVQVEIEIEYLTHYLTMD